MYKESEKFTENIEKGIRRRNTFLMLLINKTTRNINKYAFGFQLGSIS